MNERRPSSLILWVSVIIKWRRFTVSVFLLSIIIAVIYSLALRSQYTAQITLMPPNPQQDALFSLMGLGSSGLGGLSSLTGILPGTSTTSDLFAVILESGYIKGNIIEKYKLKNIFKSKTMTDANRKLKDITKIRVSPEGVISIAVTWYNRNLAADIVNSYVDELDRYNTQATMTVGKKYRLFIEQRLRETIDSLASSESELQKFQEQHHTVALDIEIENAISAIAKLKSDIILREVQRGAVASVSNFDNPYVTNIDRELIEFKKQLAKIEFGSKDTTQKEFGAGFSIPFAKLPEISLEYARLLRNVKIQEAIFELLTQQYEQAKIMEAKDTPTVQILDRAGPPEKRSLPKRKEIIVMSGLFSLILGISMSFFLEWFGQIKKQPEEYNKIKDMYVKLQNDFQIIKKFINIKKNRRH